MDEAALNAITNTDALRALVVEQMAKVAQRDIIIVSVCLPHLARQSRSP